MTNTSVCVLNMHTYIYICIGTCWRARNIILYEYKYITNLRVYTRYLTLNNNNTLLSISSRCLLLLRLFRPTSIAATSVPISRTDGNALHLPYLTLYFPE